jgi:transposase
VSHANVPLTPRTRLRLARLIVEQGWTSAAAAKMFMAAPKTARKWADRYRDEGVVRRGAALESNPRPTHYENRFVRRLWC